MYNFVGYCTICKRVDEEKKASVNFYRLMSFDSRSVARFHGEIGQKLCRPLTRVVPEIGADGRQETTVRQQIDKLRRQLVGVPVVDVLRDHGRLLGRPLLPGVYVRCQYLGHK